MAVALWAWRHLKSFFWSSRYAVIPQLILGLALVWFAPSDLPLSKCVSLPLFPLAVPNEAEEYLRTLWQVEASVLALSIAVIIFAFQAISSSDSGVELHEFADDTHLFPIFYLGIVGLLLNGVVLLGIGSGALGRGAALIATVVSGSSLMTLAWLFASTIRALAPESLQRRRIERFERAATRRVDQQVLETIALNLLNAECQKAGIDLRTWPSGSSVTGAKEVRAQRGGRVRDINLRALRSTASRARKGESTPPALLVSLGRRVAVGDVLLVLPPSTDERSVQVAEKVVRIAEER